MNWLDDLAKIPGLCRIVYNKEPTYLKKSKYYWSNKRGWMESDESLKERIVQAHRTNP